MSSDLSITPCEAIIFRSDWKIHQATCQSCSVLPVAMEILQKPPKPTPSKAQKYWEQQLSQSKPSQVKPLNWGLSQQPITKPALAVAPMTEAEGTRMQRKPLVNPPAMSSGHSSKTNPGAGFQATNPIVTPHALDNLSFRRSISSALEKHSSKELATLMCYMKDDQPPTTIEFSTKGLVEYIKLALLEGPNPELDTIIEAFCLFCDQDSGDSVTHAVLAKQLFNKILDEISLSLKEGIFPEDLQKLHDSLKHILIPIQTSNWASPELHMRITNLHDVTLVMLRVAHENY